MGILRTPDDRFRDLPRYDFTAHYVEMDGPRHAASSCRSWSITPRPAPRPASRP
jgi:hypothetical protein